MYKNILCVALLVIYYASLCTTELFPFELLKSIEIYGLSVPYLLTHLLFS